MIAGMQSLEAADTTQAEGETRLKGVERVPMGLHFFAAAFAATFCRGEARVRQRGVGDGSRPKRGLREV